MAANAKSRRKIAVVLDPRFPGGTAAAVAAEIRALDRHADLRVFALRTAMFKDRPVNPALQRALDEHGLELVWNPPVIRADIAVFHNPACLKFDTSLGPRIACRLAFVVTHENFLRPNGAESFDVAGCLRSIDAGLVAGNRYLAPVSAGNRRGVEAWVERTSSSWNLAGFDWFNICDFPVLPPAPAPRDRRGRHSRAGFEKFPPLATMLAHFPPHAELCAILGGDTLLLDPDLPAHWTVLRFGEADVASFLAQLDFFVYFTHPLWRESFGRAIAEAIAAGKVVITDPGTAESFGAAVIASDGGDVDRIIGGLIAEPRRYRRFVHAAQAVLARHGPGIFADHVLGNIERLEGTRHALL